MTDSDVLYLAVRGRTPQQNSEQDFVAVEDEEQEGSMRLEINQPLSYEETPQYTILLRASVSTLHPFLFPRRIEVFCCFWLLPITRLWKMCKLY